MNLGFQSCSGSVIKSRTKKNGDNSSVMHACNKHRFGISEDRESPKDKRRVVALNGCRDTSADKYKYILKEKEMGVPCTFAG